VGVEFTKERAGDRRESYGPLKIYVDEDVVAEDDVRTQPKTDGTARGF
jgi:hypothetical protein